MANKNDEKKGYNNYGSFILIGTAKKPKEEEKFHSKGKNAEGYEYERVGFAMEIDKSNTQFVELMGGHHTKKKATINTFDKDNNKLEVDWSDRNDKYILDKVADFKKFKANFTSAEEKESSVFLAEHDLVQAIASGLESDKRYVVIGNIKIERYKAKDGTDQVSMKLFPTKVRLAKDTEENKAEARLSFVFNKDSWDESRLKDEKKVDIMTYFGIYDRTLKQNIFVPLALMLNCEKMDFTNDKHKAIFNLQKGYFKAGKNEYFETEWHCRLFRGAEQQEISIDDLSDDQRMQVELGLASFEQIKKDMRKGLIGPKISEVRIIRPTNKFDGAVNNLMELTEEDFVIPSSGVEDKGDLFDAEEDKKDDGDVLDELFG